MPDLLGVTNPVPGYDQSSVNRNTPITPDNSPQLQNVPDLDKVTRADGRTEQEDSNLSGDGGIRYDSNFQTFLQRLRETPSLAESLSRIFMGQSVVVSSGVSAGIAEELSHMLEMLKMDESQLAEFLQGQFKTGSRFGGALFALLRNAYDRASSTGVQNDILQFLRTYVDFDSTKHIEGNILRDLDFMADAMPASWADKLRDLVAQLKNGISAGDRQGVLQLLQRNIIPYMAGYVERTHDMGTPRSLLTMLALEVARYENGSEEKLLENFHQLSGYGTLKGQLGGIDDQSLLLLLKSRSGGPERESSTAVQFADHLASAAAKAFRGEGSAEVQEAFRNLMAAMLVNESVYMPINHYILPLEWEGRMLFSELWVDPDAGDDPEPGSEKKSVMRFLFKLDVQSVGLFDIVLTTQGSNVDAQISCPEAAVPFSRQIGDAVSQILSRNDLRPLRVSVRRMERPVTLTEVFPKIFEGKNSINVKI